MQKSQFFKTITKLLTASPPPFPTAVIVIADFECPLTYFVNKYIKSRPVCEHS